MQITIPPSKGFAHRVKYVFALAVLSIFVFRQVASTQISPSTTGLPDLAIDETRLKASIVFKTLTFKSTDCALQEADKCVDAAGKRTLMKFDVAIPNIGTADFYLGNPATNSSLFTLSPCHGHYHLLGFASYELFDVSGAMVLTGRKQAFCLEDFARYSSTAGPAKYTCTNQGISGGWQDIYGSYLDCQWLDVTDIAAGDYTLRVIVNAQGVAAHATGNNVNDALKESDYDNNVALVPVKIGSKGKR